MKWLRLIAFVLALAFFILTFTNASWIADAPRGHLTLIADRAIGQEINPAASMNGHCIAGEIEPPVHDYLENTVRSFSRARTLGAQMVEMDVQSTADGHIVLFADPDLDCRTNGSGPLHGKSLVELKQLDIGAAYTADGGKSFPFRGKGVGKLPALEEALNPLWRTPILFHFVSSEPGDAELLAQALKAQKRDVEGLGDAFTGLPAPVARIRELFPKAWAWSKEAAEKCSSDYILYGWSGIMPASCTGGTMAIPLNRQWLFWGFPNRLGERMQGVGGHIILTGPADHGWQGGGLMLPEQLRDVPSTYRGYLAIDNIWDIGPSLYPSMERRSPDEQIRAEAGLERLRQSL